MPGSKFNFKKLFKQVAIFFAILGPGIITGSVDNDAGGITTYSVAGAMYGYGLIWTLIPSFIVLVVIQEMNARMGIVTGKGLADLIRENAGIKITFLIFIGLLLSGIGNTTTEFAGVAGSMEVFGVSKYISVPIVGILVWLLVVKGTYKTAERIFLIFSVSLLTYVVSAIMGKPEWHAIGTAIIHPKFAMTTKSMAMVIGLVGTTIAPWMLLFRWLPLLAILLHRYSHSGSLLHRYFLLLYCRLRQHFLSVRLSASRLASIRNGMKPRNFTFYIPVFLSSCLLYTSPSP